MPFGPVCDASRSIAARKRLRVEVETGGGIPAGLVILRVASPAIIYYNSYHKSVCNSAGNVCRNDKLLGFDAGWCIAVLEAYQAQKL